LIRRIAVRVFGHDERLLVLLVQMPPGYKLARGRRIDTTGAQKHDPRFCEKAVW